jgi:hypothetical protein
MRCSSRPRLGQFGPGEGEHLGGRPHPHHAAIDQQRDAVAKGERLGAVRDEDDGAALGSALEVAQEGFLGGDVERAGGLKRRGLRISARASAMSCRWPADRPVPRSPSCVS